MSMEIARGQIQSKAIQDRDEAEFRELSQRIDRIGDDIKILLKMQPFRESHPVEEPMESLQIVSKST